LWELDYSPIVIRIPDGPEDYPRAHHPCVVPILPPNLVAYIEGTHALAFMPSHLLNRSGIDPVL